MVVLKLKKVESVIHLCFLKLSEVWPIIIICGNQNIKIKSQFRGISPYGQAYSLCELDSKLLSMVVKDSSRVTGCCRKLQNLTFFSIPGYNTTSLIVPRKQRAWEQRSKRGREGSREQAKQQYCSLLCCPGIFWSFFYFPDKTLNFAGGQSCWRGCFQPGTCSKLKQIS